MIPRAYEYCRESLVVNSKHFDSAQGQLRSPGMLSQETICGFLTPRERQLGGWKASVRRRTLGFIR